MAVNLFQFYESILRDEMCLIPGDEEEEMEMALDILLASYSVAGLKIADSLNFNRRELRCAYLFLFSTSHSHMVLDALNRLHEENYSELLNLIADASRSHGTFNITSLGGGPGSDPLGILTFLYEKGFLGSCPVIKVSLVDEYIGWESIFQQVMKRFQNGLVRAQFKTQNLLLPFSSAVQAVLKNTHFLSMVKFVSAVSGNKTKAVASFQHIFSLLQPGTIVLIIDNAGGQDFNQALNLAKRAGLLPVMEPVLHYQFKVPKMQEQGLGRLQYGKRPQSSSTISMAILKKRGSSLSNYIEPVIKYQEPNLFQARTERSNGYITGLELASPLEEFSVEKSLSEELSLEESSSEELLLEDTTFEGYSFQKYSSEDYLSDIYSLEELSLEESPLEEYTLEETTYEEYSFEKYSSEDYLSDIYSFEALSLEESPLEEYTSEVYLSEEYSEEVTLEEYSLKDYLSDVYSLEEPPLEDYTSEVYLSEEYWLDEY